MESMIDTRQDINFKIMTSLKNIVTSHFQHDHYIFLESTEIMILKKGKIYPSCFNCILILVQDYVCLENLSLER